LQAYLHVKPGRVEGVAGGTYYYAPADHQLVILGDGAGLDRTVHIEFINRPIYDQAAFSVLLFADARAIVPMYGRSARDFCLLEAGYMSQLLMMTAPAHGIGLCPIGGIDAARVAQVFALDETHELVHSLLGGATDDEAEDTWAPFREDARSADAENDEREEILI
jgi:SagB-type dehydrogenase family enzyme